MLVPSSRRGLDFASLSTQLSVNAGLPIIGNHFYLFCYSFWLIHIIGAFRLSLSVVPESAWPIWEKYVFQTKWFSTKSPQTSGIALHVFDWSQHCLIEEPSLNSCIKVLLSLSAKLHRVSHLFYESAQKMPAPPNYVFSTVAFIAFFLCLVRFPMQLHCRS